LEVKPHIVITQKSADRVLFDETISGLSATIRAPGSWESQVISAPILPLWELYIPAELNIIFKLSLTSKLSLMFSTVGLDPQGSVLDFTTASSTVVIFDKPSGVGGEIKLTGATAKVSGSVVMSAGLSVVNFQTPLKIDFLNIPIAEFTAHSTQNTNLALLKTPLTANIDINPSKANLGDVVTVRGYISPPARDLPIQVIVDGTIIGSTTPNSDGSFVFMWTPSQVGTHSVKVELPETRYTTYAASSTIQFTVEERGTTLSFLIVIIAAIVVAAVIAIAIFVIKKKEKSDPMSSN